MSNDILNIEQVYKDFGIDHATEGGKHCGAGWVQTHCPFCTGSKNYHLGYKINEGYFNCWRCGWHRTDEVLKALNIDIRATHENYAQRPVNKNRGEGTKKRNRLKSAPVPPATDVLDDRHKTYLRGRNFNSGKLVQYFGLLGTGPVGFYKNRILAPILYNGAMVSYQCRDITGRSDKKYLACMQQNEVREHQKCIYGAELVPGKKIVVVEGITDVWRLGPGAVAVFGIDFTTAQVLELKRYEEIYIVFDIERSAQKQATKLANALSPFCKVTLVGSQGDYQEFSVDPGSMKQDVADHFMHELGLGWKTIKSN